MRPHRITDCTGASHSAPGSHTHTAVNLPGFAVTSEAHACFQSGDKVNVQKLTIMAVLSAGIHRVHRKSFLWFSVNVQTSNAGPPRNLLKPRVGDLDGFGYYIKSVDVIVRPVPKPDDDGHEQLIYPCNTHPAVG